MLELNQLSDILIKSNCKRLLVKRLAPNDNTKNQVYFGSNFESLNLIPNTGIYSDSSGKNPIFKAGLSFYWLTEEGKLALAPNAKLILYSQYPEVRFSGFLLGCKDSPSKLFQPREDGMNKLPERLLFLGLTEDGTIIGHTVPINSSLAQEFLALGWHMSGVFYDATTLLYNTGENSKQLLLLALRRIHEKGWIESKILQKDGTVRQCKGTNCGGFTLEAELGIVPNGKSDPDYLGWEIKQHGVTNFTNLVKRVNSGAITLMTPEPTAGFYKDSGVKEFVIRYGYPDMSGIADRYNFGGVHKSGHRHPTTGLTLRLNGYNIISEKITDANGGLSLYNDKGEPAATWEFSNLMTHWNKKHAQAAYIPSINQTTNNQREYQYGHLVRLGEGTDFLKFLRAVAEGFIYYDPGIKVENISTRPKQKTRSQFRIKSGDIRMLYESLTTESLI